MASETEHINLANHNHEVLMRLLEEADAYADWIATVAFYKAVHVVEAVFAHHHGSHSASHSQREMKLTLPNYAKIGTDYSHLSTTSRVARYLAGGGGPYSKFSDYLDVDGVKHLIRKRLYGVEQKCLQYLSDKGKSALLKIEPPKIK